jgi:oligogalacturonide lyase
MKMKGSTYKQEWTLHRDELTGRTIKQLTSLRGNHHHLYFTSSSFTADNQSVLFISDGGVNQPNLYKLSLEDGMAVQLTDNQSGYMRSYVYYEGNPYQGLAKASPSYDPATNKLLYIQGSEVRLLAVDTLAEETIYTLPDGVMTGFTHLSSDGRYACIPYIDAEAFEVGEVGNPFSHIRDKVKREGLESQLLVIDLATKKGEIWGSQVGWITHVQFQPGDSSAILYNHEGGMVDQRIWLYRNGMMDKIRDQSAEQGPVWICHEMWLQQGNGVLYHGTKGIPQDPAMKAELRHSPSDAVSFVGRYELDNGQYKELAFPREMQAYGHFTASSDDRQLVTDGIIDGQSIHLCQPDWDNLQLTWTPICRHNSSFSVQDVHPHPIFSHDNRHILFTSDAHNEPGKGHVYLVEV